MKRLAKIKENYKKAKYLLTLEGNEEWDKFCDEKFIEVTDKIYHTLEAGTYILAIIIYTKIIYDTCV